MLWILRTVLLAVIWVALVILLSVAFTITYMRIVPISEHKVPLFFEYKSTSAAQATTQFPAMLRAGQYYRVVLDLTVPDLIDAALSNFMIHARLSHGPRTGLLRRRSWFVEIAYKALRLPLYLTNILEETRTDTILLEESFRESSTNPVTSVTVELTSIAAKVPECFSSQLLFSANLTLIQSILVRYRLLLFVLIVIGGASILTMVIGVTLLIKQYNHSDLVDVRDIPDLVIEKSSDSFDSESSEEYSADEQLVPLL